MVLAQNTQIKVLKLGYNSLGDSGVQVLCPAVSQHTSLESLDIGFNQVGDEGCKALIEAIMTNNSRRESQDNPRSWTLYLAGNLIGEDGAHSIADLISRQQHKRNVCPVRRLYLTGNKLGPTGIKAIADSILSDELARRQALQQEGDGSEVDQSEFCSDRGYSGGGMEELFLGGTCIGSVGCAAISRVLEQSQYLKTMSLPNCDITDDIFYSLAATIKTNRSKLPLESLQLSFNRITCKGMEALSNAIWGSTTLKELLLDNNEIGDAGAQLVATVIPGITAPLESLNVGFNKIKSAGMRVLMKAVAGSQSLRSLSVAGNTVDTTSAKFIAYALAHNSSLLSISLDHCSIAQEGRRQIVAGIVSNSRTKLREVRGFNMGPVVVTLGFPSVMEHWNNEHVVNFIHLMWQRSKLDAPDSIDDFMDPLHFLGSSDGEEGSASSSVGPHEAHVVVEVASKAFVSLVEEGVDVFSRRPGHPCGYADASPVNWDNRLLIRPASSENSDANHPHDLMRSFSLVRPKQSFVAPPEETKSGVPDPSRKKRIVEWLCVNIQHLNKLGHRPFSSAELWKLHQHYFTPVVNETGGSVAPSPSPSTHSSAVGMSSVPEVSITSTKNQGDGIDEIADEPMTVQMSDPSIKASPFGGISPLPLLKRKVSYRFLGDAALQTAPCLEVHYSGDVRPSCTYSAPTQNGSVSMMIETGPTGHTMPPKTKRARRNRSRISFLPRVKAKLDSSLDVCHEKALVTMRQLYYVEQAILSGQVNPVDPITTSRTHLCGDFATDAEMIVCDMI
jgi:Ran GTPase-activating protein (RanGAP) involved in mRNA processing and transport